MTKTICPHCGYDSTTLRIVMGVKQGMLVSAAMGLCTLFNRKFGVAALGAGALAAWYSARKTEAQCPNCGDFYHD